MAVEVVHSDYQLHRLVLLRLLLLMDLKLRLVGQGLSLVRGRLSLKDPMGPRSSYPFSFYIVLRYELGLMIGFELL